MCIEFQCRYASFPRSVIFSHDKAQLVLNPEQSVQDVLDLFTVMNKRSSSNVNSYLVFHSVLKTLAQN